MKDIDCVFDCLDEATQRHSYSCCDRAIKYASTHCGDDLSLNLPIACLYHDVGKIDYLDLVTKCGPLTESERHLINYHPINSYLICKEYGLDEHICKGVLLHHDPNMKFIAKLLDEHPHINSNVLKGVTAADIELATCISMIDITDSLLENRPYRKSMSRRDACAIFANNFPDRVFEFINIA